MCSSLISAIASGKQTSLDHLLSLFKGIVHSLVFVAAIGTESRDTRRSILGHYYNRPFPSHWVPQSARRKPRERHGDMVGFLLGYQYNQRVSASLFLHAVRRGYNKIPEQFLVLTH